MQNEERRKRELKKQQQYNSDIFANKETETIQKSELEIQQQSISIASANGYQVKNASVEAFNARVEEALPDYYIDIYTFLVSCGYETVDGVHYGSDTYIEIQNLTMLLIEAKEEELER